MNDAETRTEEGQNQMARLVRFHEFGGPEVLRIETAEIAAPADNEVQIRVKALGLNRAEALMREGKYIETPTLPSGLGLEAAGIVQAVGKDVTGIAKGDAVSVIPPISQIQNPAYGELINMPAQLVVRHPKYLTWEEAAATWMAYVTAYGALIEIAKLGPEDFVLITAASSSVGIAAIQLAKMAGATPIAVTRTQEKFDALRAAGATHIIALSDGEFEQSIAAIAGECGVRVAFDAVGGRELETIANVMAYGGILLTYGAQSAEASPYPIFQILGKSLTFRGYLIHEVVRDTKRLARAKRFIAKGLRSGDLKPVIARTFSFNDIVDAHRFLDSGQQVGKLVVTMA